MKPAVRVIVNVEFADAPWANESDPLLNAIVKAGVGTTTALTVSANPADAVTPVPVARIVRFVSAAAALRIATSRNGPATS